MARQYSVVKPDCTVTIESSDGSPMLVAGIFIEEAGKVDVGMGWDEQTELSYIYSLLQAVSLALTGTIAWVSTDDIMAENKRRASEGDEIPF